MPGTTKTERIDIRLKDEHKEALLRAASLLGLTLSDFVVSTSVEKANEILRSQTMITMSPRDLDRFVRALDEDAEPNEALKKAAARYRKHVSEGDKAR